LLLLYQANVENISTLAKQVLMDGSTLMIAGSMDLLPISALGLIVVILAARIAAAKGWSFIKPPRAQSAFTHHRATDHLFERSKPTLKPCPNCAKELPLAAIICDACDYNFLAARPGRGQKLLPAPEPTTDEVPEQRIAAAGL
jgi:hypothetical protein